MVWVITKRWDQLREAQNGTGSCPLEQKETNVT